MRGDMSNYDYIGQELDSFSKAVNWKRYWFETIRPYIGKRVLEVGAGIGSNTEISKVLDLEDWLCLEPDANLSTSILTKIRCEELRTEVRLQCGTMDDLAEGELFDTILYIDVLEHILDDKQELEMAEAHLVPGGCIVVVAPAHNYLYSPFDKAIGHHRRYNKSLLRTAKPAGCHTEELYYLDSIGFFASLANRLILKESQPKLSHVQFWDKYLVPMSRFVDPLIFFKAGKTIVALFRKENVNE